MVKYLLKNIIYYKVKQNMADTEIRSPRIGRSISNTAIMTYMTPIQFNISHLMQSVQNYNILLENKIQEHKSLLDIFTKLHKRNRDVTPQDSESPFSGRRQPNERIPMEVSGQRLFSNSSTSVSEPQKKRARNVIHDSRNYARQNQTLNEILQILNEIDVHFEEYIEDPNEILKQLKIIKEKFKDKQLLNDIILLYQTDVIKNIIYRLQMLIIKISLLSSSRIHARTAIRTQRTQRKTNYEIINNVLKELKIISKIIEQISSGQLRTTLGGSKKLKRGGVTP